MGFAAIIEHLLPTGEAFRVGVDKVLRRLLRGLAGSADAVQAEADLGILDLYPSHTRELKEWEAQYGLSPAPGATEAERRLALAAEWRSTGGQSAAYIQGVLQAAGFNVYVHESRENGLASSPLKDPRDYTLDPVYGTMQCGETWAECGDYDAQCDAFLANDPLYWDSLDLTLRAPPIITSDSSKWPFFLYVGAATFPDMASVPLARKDEFRRLLEKLKPQENWVVTRVTYT